MDQRPEQSHVVAILVVLTFVTGLVDAATYLGLGHVFAANMTGNVVLLGFALAAAGGISATASIISLAAFLIGSAAGGALTRSLQSDRRRWVGAALVIETLGVVLAAVGVSVVLSAYVVVALLALAMGMRNAMVRRLGVADLTTTVLTMTITGLGADTFNGGASKQAHIRRIASVVSMLIGAFIGAVLVNYALFAPLALAAGVLVLTTAGWLRAARAL